MECSDPGRLHLPTNLCRLRSGRTTNTSLIETTPNQVQYARQSGLAPDQVVSSAGRPTESKQTTVSL
ncbi:MAG TPA: hypothetical protein DDX19_14160 [Rhodopirellula baltica]|uniref:Uncharacterized protein n=1 Tax=Rhodopirellula baltica (strain DSM 10527 / NCIMB 13988 / SH1) TaxID=243090 RepID=Q7UKD8_RHOBA|nr:hypothetical protein RB10699 [Rhodopirellula baltica SH 1]HBE63852.1 hypothetical protein [Rhodopirellula baltica]